ncbi:MAG: hypothetical protein HY952_11180 [Elusimicrobia bacterium]|nr:hypothetical protein [Elusimicrobiota bacterium]
MGRASVVCKTFAGGAGGAEHYISVSAPAGGGFDYQLRAVEDAYAAALRALRLPPSSAVFRRIFLSDPANQAARLAASRLAADPRGGAAAVSVFGQPPLPAGRLALLAYHLGGKFSSRRLSPRHVLVEKGGLGHLWSVGLGGAAAGRSSAEQTRGAFAQLENRLKASGATLRGNCVRTWLQVRDIDVNYSGMVAARRALFLKAGLTPRTHYIASTGINGEAADQSGLVVLDSYSVLGLRRGQVEYLNASGRLCHAKKYKVTFERGVRLAYADRAHCLISGTASIDEKGLVMHPGDALRQMERAVGNVAALLRAGGARPKDLQHLTVYIRDAADHPAVSGFLKDNFPSLPVCVVRAPVCRPGWLVEVEGAAAVSARCAGLPAF